MAYAVASNRNQILRNYNVATVILITKLLPNYCVYIYIEFKDLSLVQCIESLRCYSLSVSN